MVLQEALRRRPVEPPAGVQLREGLPQGDEVLRVPPQVVDVQGLAAIDLGDAVAHDALVVLTRACDHLLEGLKLDQVVGVQQRFDYLVEALLQLAEACGVEAVRAELRQDSGLALVLVQVAGVVRVARAELLQELAVPALPQPLPHAGHELQGEFEEVDVTENHHFVADRLDLLLLGRRLPLQAEVREAVEELLRVQGPGLVLVVLREGFLQLLPLLARQPLVLPPALQEELADLFLLTAHLATLREVLQPDLLRALLRHVLQQRAAC
mmetsp:Transcript_65318/g.183947  ORF Transcript_65318/g.183947 Transcript_65318/m.183947 type:complete len:268 (-) Transcript_65318:80-883(-)